MNLVRKYLNSGQLPIVVTPNGNRKPTFEEAFQPNFEEALKKSPYRYEKPLEIVSPEFGLFMGARSLMTGASTGILSLLDRINTTAQKTRAFNKRLKEIEKQGRGFNLEKRGNFNKEKPSKWAVIADAANPFF